MGSGWSWVRGEVASNLSTTTCVRPCDDFAIALNLATILSRPQPMPRFGSSQEESVLRVPQETSSSMVARSDFSSGRSMGRARRGSNFTAGIPPRGSMGSWPARDAVPALRMIAATAKMAAMLEARSWTLRWQITIHSLGWAEYKGAIIAAWECRCLACWVQKAEGRRRERAEGRRRRAEGRRQRITDY